MTKIIRRQPYLLLFHIVREELYEIGKPKILREKRTKRESDREERPGKSRQVEDL